MPFGEELWNLELFATAGGTWQGRGRRSGRVLSAAAMRGAAVIRVYVLQAWEVLFQYSARCSNAVVQADGRLYEHPWPVRKIHA